MAKAKTGGGLFQDIKKDGKRAARQAAYSPLMERFARLGYAVKGFIYVAIGYIALLSAVGKSRTPADQLGAIAAFGKLPYADIFLWIIFIGLIAYSVGGVVRAALDPYHKGSDTAGLLARAGYLISAVTYASFAVATYGLIKGAKSSSGTNQTVHLVSRLMQMPFGRFLVAGVGLAAIAAGLYQIYMGITLNFDQRFKPYALSAEQMTIARQVGRFGTIARGIVFALVGFFFCLAAYYANPSHAQGFAGALRFLGQQPYGLWLLGIIAVGLIAFGIYSLMSAAWFRMKDSRS